MESETLETIQLSLDEAMDSTAISSRISMDISTEQEAAIEAFFQINNWQLIKESKSEKPSEDGRITLTIHATAEQEAALHAFFQINSWNVTCVKQGLELVEDGGVENTGAEIVEQQGDEMEGSVQAVQSIVQEQTAGETTVEEVAGLQEVPGLQMIKVTTTDTDGKPQVITVFAEDGEAKEIPASLLEGLSDNGRDMPQVIIQEITLPDGMSLDQGLVIANPSINAIKRITPRGSIRPGDKVHKCHVCGKMFKQLQSFNGHYQSHFGAKPFKCEVCNKGFTLKAALVSHQTIHTGAKPFVCSLCNKGFRRKDDMVCHLRTHTGEKPYECDICGKKFKYRNQVPKHRRFHTGERPYPCTFCDKKFTSNIHLSRHVRTHTGERPYKCEHCQKSFTQYGHLQAHTRIHSDERPFGCDVCGRKFREKKVMKRHELLHTTERKFKCDVCGRGFLRQSNLDLHAVMHQTGPKDGGLRRGRPKPKKKQADAEMREFVANVLSSVKKVDSSMQTDNFVNGIPADDDGNPAADNLSAFVNFAVQQDNNMPKVENMADIQNSVEDNQQFTLVMQDDGSGGYLISNYDGSAVTEEIVNSIPTQQIEETSGYNAATSAGQDTAHKEEKFTTKPVSSNMFVKTVDKIIYATDTENVNENINTTQVVESSFDSEEAEGDIVMQEEQDVGEEEAGSESNYNIRVVIDGNQVQQDVQNV